MPAKSVIVEKQVSKRLAKLPLKIHKRVIEALDILKLNPLSGVKLHGELDSYYKYRIGDYRIVYRFNAKESVVIIVKMEHRQGVYK